MHPKLGNARIVVSLRRYAIAVFDTQVITVDTTRGTRSFTPLHDCMSRCKLQASFGVSLLSMLPGEGRCMG